MPPISPHCLLLLPLCTTLHGLTMPPPTPIPHLHNNSRLSDGDGKTADGAFPRQLAALTGLINVNLAGNNFGGKPIPSSIIDLPKIISMTLSYNGFGGVIPTGIEKLTKLASLSINDNNLEGTIPQGIKNLKNFYSFDFRNNTQLSGSLPDFANDGVACIGENTNVCVPDGHKGDSCGITKACPYTAPAGSDCAILQDAIPSLFKDVFCCKVDGVSCDADNRATKLLLPNKSISGQLSVKIGGLTKLQELDFSNNDIEGPLPDVFDKLTSLTSLNIANNKLTGPIPKTLAQLASITKLDISGNTGMDGALPGFPATLADCKGTNTGICVPQDVTLAQSCGVTKDCPYIAPDGSDCATLQSQLPLFYKDKFCCKVPGTPCNKDGRVTLIIKPGPKKTGKRDVTSIINGPFPDLGNLTYLEKIDFSNNDIEGPLPELFDKLTSLASLNVANNKLTGPIPATLAELASLTKLDISGNTGMDGTLPGFPATLADCKGTDTGICVPAGLTGTNCGIETKYDHHNNHGHDDHDHDH
ncbi:hypothetical protein BC831DRAFT_538972 [Entophlyctis helioformis]|nr:hypothetical protein BC831DRAFT_538972 [Entophlyctis helioformis]